MSDAHDPTRRTLLATLAAGLAATATSAAGASDEAAPPISKATLVEAEKIAGLELTDAERELMLKGVNELRQDYAKLRTVDLPNDVAPAFRFDPELVGVGPDGAGEVRWEVRGEPAQRPRDEDELAFLTVAEQADLLARRKLRSVDLTNLYLRRLERLDPKLHCVISRLEQRAMAQAEAADREIQAGRHRGPLHGIPWGAKDLLAVRGAPTTWGAAPFRAQTLDVDAAAVERLDAAGAVLLAKLTLGALAWGDVWFGGKTRNPWNLEQGSSGSSAGSASATAAGACSFAIGSETWGSIVSPATRCGCTGLRPTFGRVSRHGAMALSWTMDKLGPITRSVEDCALVFGALHGADPRDPTSVTRAFHWPPRRPLRELRVGYVKDQFEAEVAAGGEAARANDLASLDALRHMGITLRPIALPEFPTSALSFVLSAEAAAAFDELTRSDRDDQLTRQIEHAWPNVFRQARTIPAVEYIQASRARTLLCQKMAELMQEIDVYVSPTFGGDNLLRTNLSGHPQVVLPNGFAPDGTPTSITFTGQLWGEEAMLQLAHRYQVETGFHRKHPRP